MSKCQLVQLLTNILDAGTSKGASWDLDVMEVLPKMHSLVLRAHIIHSIELSIRIYYRILGPLDTPLCSAVILHSSFDMPLFSPTRPVPLIHAQCPVPLPRPSPRHCRQNRHSSATRYVSSFSRHLLHNHNHVAHASKAGESGKKFYLDSKMLCLKSEIKHVSLKEITVWQVVRFVQFFF